MRKLLSVLAVFCFCCFVASFFAAQARADISSVWNYDVNARITNVTPSHKGWSETTGYGTKQKTRYSFIESTQNDSKLSWGVEVMDCWGGISRESESSLQMTPINGGYEMGTGPKDALKFTHKNSPLTGKTGSDVPWPAFIDIVLDFNISNAANPLIGGNASVNLHMGFWETPNSGDHYVGFPDDIFYFLDPFASYDQIRLADSDYYLSLYSSFEKLDGIYYEAAASQLGITDGTDIWGWVTPENSSNDFFVGFEISETLPGPGDATVPEPATMLIFGAGLAGLGILRCRRKSVQPTEVTEAIEAY